MQALQHQYDFDPTHGYRLDDLLQVDAPSPPAGFEHFWRNRYEKALEVKPLPILKDTGGSFKGWRIFDIQYTSTDSFSINGWLLYPENKEPRRGFVITHGYGGREEPDYHLPFEDSVFLFPCIRGTGKSQRPPISSEPNWHVLHDIDKVDRYVIGGCVEDIWCGVNTLIRLFPYVAGHIGYLGISFGGGLGAFASNWPIISNVVVWNLDA